MGEFLNRYTDRQPLLLLTEDLHWADNPTIQLIDYLARRRSGGSLMWLSSFRLSEVIASEHPLNALRHQLHLHGLCEEIVLDPLCAEREVTSLVTEATNSGTPSVRSCRVSPPPRCLRMHRFRRTSLPSSISTWESSIRRSACCSPRLRCAAMRVGSTHWRACSSVTISGSRTCANRLLREQLWLAPRAKHEADSRAGTYSFRHALFREVLYERLAPSARAERHRKVGTALEQERSTSLGVAASELGAVGGARASGAPAHAPARLRIRAGQQRRRYRNHPGLLGPQKHSTHGEVHPARTTAI